MMNKKITIKDIARQLGVSIATVSRALNNKEEVNNKTQERILKYVSKTNYQLNQNAKNLKQQTSNTIGVLIPSIDHHFFARAISAIEQTVAKENFSVIITQSHEKWDNERKIINNFLANRVAGVIVSIAEDSDSPDHFNRLLHQDIPVVFFDRGFKKDIKATRVITDDFGGAYQAVEHLIKRGYKKIAHIGGNRNLEICQERYQGYKQALEDYNIESISDLIISEGIKRIDGENGFCKLWRQENKPDAIFCVNDPVAVGVFNKCEEMDLNIPDNVAVVGFSNSELARFLCPPLTTIDQSESLMGERAAQILLEQIKDGNKNINKKEVMKTKLIIRNSS